MSGPAKFQARQAPAPAAPPAPAILRVEGGGIRELPAGERPAIVVLRPVPGLKPGPVAFLPSLQAAESGVLVHAVELAPGGTLVAACSAIGTRTAVIAPGDILGALPP